MTVELEFQPYGYAKFRDFFKGCHFMHEGKRVYISWTYSPFEEYARYFTVIADVPKGLGRGYIVFEFDYKAGPDDDPILRHFSFPIYPEFEGKVYLGTIRTIGDV